MESTSAHALDRRLADLVRSERHLAARFVIELAAFAKRELYRELGYTSLFTYCVRQLGLSKSAAFRRSEAARLIARFPAIAARLAEGRLSIRALVELREVLTEENHAFVLARAEGKSQEEAQMLAVEIKPRPVPRDVIRAVPRPARTALPASVAGSAQQPGPSSPHLANLVVPAGTWAAPGPGSTFAAPDAVVPAGTWAPPGPGSTFAAPDAVVPAGTTPRPRPPEIVKPLTPELRRLNVTVSAEFVAELEQVRAALSHTCPDGDFERVVREAFRLVLERDRKRKALTDRPRATLPMQHRQPPQQKPEQRHQEQEQQQEQEQEQEQQHQEQPPAPEALHRSRGLPGTGRYIPAAVRRAVWERDRGRCTWPMGDGKVCGTTHRLEFDHDLEVALGGQSTLGNIRLLCRSHNLLKADQHLGRAFMATFRKTGRSSETPRDAGDARCHTQGVGDGRA